MNEITMDMAVNPETILEGAEESYPSALKQIQEMGVSLEDAPKVLYAIGFCRASELMYQSMQESIAELLTSIQESIEKDEDVSVEYTAKKGIFTAKDLEELKEQSNVPKNLN
jgi:hypothetical protein|nr:MAG TPA: UBA1-like domain protein [Caudoviricetes sp.]